MGNQISPFNKINYKDNKNHPFINFVVDTLLDSTFYGSKNITKKDYYV